MTYEDLVEENDHESVESEKVDERAKMSADEKAEPSSDLKISLLDKHTLKRTIYSAIMKRIKPNEAAASIPTCLFEVKIANDVFTFTIMILNLKTAQSSADNIIAAAFTEALKYCLS